MEPDNNGFRASLDTLKLNEIRLSDCPGLQSRSTAIPSVYKFSHPVGARIHDPESLSKLILALIGTLVLSMIIIRTRLIEGGGKTLTRITYSTPLA